MDQSRTLIEHLEELRRRLGICVAAVIFGTGIAYFFVPSILSWISKPVGNLVFTSIEEPFLVTLNIALIGGLFLASPVCLYQFWAFISVGLKETEKSWFRLFFPISLGLFLGGAFFAWGVVIPLAIRFLIGFPSMDLQPMITLGRYVSFWGIFAFLFGLIFQIPLLVLFLCSTGLMNPDQIAKQRGLMVLVIFIVAAILTPPDVVSQFLMAMPMWLLFELGLLLSRMTQRVGKTG